MRLLLFAFYISVVTCQLTPYAPKLKLTYFNVRGRAEPIRLMLHYATVPFEDERVETSQWAALKQRVPFGQLPILNVNGRDLAESWAIYRYIARNIRIAGQDPWEMAEVEQTGELFRDWYDVAYVLEQVESGIQSGNKTAVLDNYTSTSKRVLPLVQQQLKPNGFFANSGVTWVDFLIADGININLAKHPEVIQQFGKLVEHSNKVLSLPQIQNYLKTRKSND